MTHKNQILFISHGGGPMPILGDESHKEMVTCLVKISEKLKKPSVIILISAHWEEKTLTITASKNPPLIYDYYGFPEESYRIEYPCNGEPALAKKIHQLFKNAGILSSLDEKRGFDHGMFIPLKIMFPNAEIPCVQISLLSSLVPAKHIKIGKILTDLKHDNILFIGSGFSFHNMKVFFSKPANDAIEKNEAFEKWLSETCSSPSLNEREREERLKQWELAPSARYCHPREEHLLPLHVCYGIAQSKCSEFFELQILNKKSSMYLWQN